MNYRENVLKIDMLLNGGGYNVRGCFAWKTAFKYSSV